MRKEYIYELKSSKKKRYKIHKIIDYSRSILKLCAFCLLFFIWIFFWVFITKQLTKLGLHIIMMVIGTGTIGSLQIFQYIHSKT